MLERVRWSVVIGDGLVPLDFKNAQRTVWLTPQFVRFDRMENGRKVRSKVFFRGLRVLAGLMTLIAGIALSFGCIAALLGDQEMLIDFIDDDTTSLVMAWPTIAAIAATNLMGVSALAMMFFSLNRFLKYAEKGEMLIDPARSALRQLGVAMMLLYLTSRFVAVLIPLVGIPGFWMENRFALPFIFLDLDFLYLLVGVVLLALGEALQEGQAAKEETKQYI